MPCNASAKFFLNTSSALNDPVMPAKRFGKPCPLYLFSPNGIVPGSPKAVPFNSGAKTYQSLPFHLALGFNPAATKASNSLWCCVFHPLGALSETVLPPNNPSIICNSDKSSNPRTSPSLTSIPPKKDCSLLSLIGSKVAIASSTASDDSSSVSVSPPSRPLVLNRSTSVF